VTLKYFYDCEFLEDGRTVDLISIGIVAEDGREFYAVNAEAPWKRIRKHDWLMANVVPHLPPAARGWAFAGRITVPLNFAGHHLAMKKVRIAEKVQAFVGEGGADRADHELWAYYGAYDHVVLCQLWGTMMDLPGCVPMWTHDLMQISEGIDLAQEVPQQDEHHALADARWNRDAYNYLESLR
jgi:hypothetical protein